YVYSTASKHLHDKMLDDTLNNYNSDCLGNKFSHRSGRCTEYEKDDGVKIYTDNWDAFLITDDKTMICISGLYEKNLDYSELFDYVRELLKKY
nr:hypothetical protein [Lachnospiraceae bacterium]